MYINRGAARDIDDAIHELDLLRDPTTKNQVPHMREIKPRMNMDSNIDLGIENHQGSDNMNDPRLAAMQKLLGGGQRAAMPPANTGMPHDALMQSIMDHMGGQAAPPPPGPGAGVPQQLASLTQSAGPAPDPVQMMSGDGFGGDAQSGEHVADMIGTMTPRNEQPNYHGRGFDPYMKFPNGVPEPYRQDDPMDRPVPRMKPPGDSANAGGQRYAKVNNDAVNDGTPDDEALLGSVQDEIFNKGKGRESMAKRQGDSFKRASPDLQALYDDIPTVEKDVKAVVSGAMDENAFVDKYEESVPDIITNVLGADPKDYDYGQ